MHQPVDVSRIPPALSQVLMAEIPDRFPGRPSEMALSLYAALVSDGKALPGSGAEEMAQLAIRLVVQLCNDFGGTSFYLHKSPIVQRFRTQAMRDASIAEAFNGTNFVELAKSHGLTEMRIRQIVAHQRQLKRKPIRLSAAEIEARDKAIAAQFTGRNQAALAAKSGLTVSTINKIVAAQRPARY